MQQQPPRKLLDQVSNAIRAKHYSYRTEQTYKDWIKRYILFHNKRHPKNMGAPEIQAFITHLAAEKMSPPPPKTKPSAPSFFSTVTSS